MKNIVRSVASRFGLDIRRLTASTNTALQTELCLRYLDIDVLFDIGANVGQFAHEVRSSGYKNKIVSFEPLNHEHAILYKNASNDVNWTVHDVCAIGNYDGKIQINISQNSVSSSILEMEDIHKKSALKSSFISSQKTTIKKLDTIASKYFTNKNKIFIKIDTQGYEREVISGGIETLGAARGVLCELSMVELYSGQSLWQELVERFEHMGFRLWAIQPGFTNTENGQTLQFDGIFVRSDFL